MASKHSNTKVVLCVVLVLFIIFISGYEESLRIDPSSMPKNIDYAVGEEKLLYNCKTNLAAQFLWKVCQSFHPNVWHEDSSYKSCEKMFKNQSFYCKIIKPNTFTKNDYYYLDNGVMAYFSQLVLDHVQQPHQGCILCTAVRNNSVVSAFTHYTYRDECGRPSHQEAAHESYMKCHSRSGFDLTKKKCESSKPEDLEVIQQLNEHGFVDTYVKWKNPKGSNDGVIYGYKINVEKIINGDKETEHRCYITKRYEETQNEDMQNILNKLKLNIEEHQDNILYTANVSDVIGYQDVSQQAEYTISVHVLPTSDPVTISFKESTQEDLCNEYYEKHNFLPFMCYMVTNVTVLNCFPDKFVNVSWDIAKQIKFENFTGMTSISWHDCSGHSFYENFKIDQKYFVFYNESSRCSYGSIQLKFANEYGYEQYFSFNCSALHLKSQNQIAENKVVIYITIAALVAVVCLCSVFAVKFKRDLILLVQKLQTYKDVRSNSIRGLDIENIPLKSDQFVMIVFPHGCGKLEKVVIALALIMRSVGLNVLVDTLQSEKVAEKGLSKVLLSDFDKADYVVVLCTEPKDTSYENHNIYNFMLHNIETACICDNINKYIAVYFDSCDGFIPLYLRQRKYLLPSLMDIFLQNLHGVKTTYSTIFPKIWEEGAEIVKLKKKFGLLCKEYNDNNHIGCNPNYCRKAFLEENDPCNSSICSSLNFDTFEASNDNLNDEASSNSINEEDFDLQRDFILEKDIFLKKTSDQTVA